MLVPFPLFALCLGLTGIQISIFGTDTIHVTHDGSFLLILALNGIGIAGRIFPAWLVPYCGGVLNVFTFVCFCAGLLLYLWALVRNLSGLIAFVIVYGFFANAVQSMFVGGVGSLTKDKQKMGARIGMIFSTVSFACLTGPPIAGALITARDGDFLYAQMFGGTTLVLSSVALLGAAILKNRV